jgi:carbamoyltransferase
MHILGNSCFYHDSSACLVRDGKIVAAAQEERFSRKKHDPRLPINAIESCLKEVSLAIEDVDCIVYYDKPFLTFERLLMSYLTVAPNRQRSWLQAMPLWIGQKLHLPKAIKKETGYKGDIFFYRAL